LFTKPYEQLARYSFAALAPDVPERGAKGEMFLSSSTTVLQRKMPDIFTTAKRSEVMSRIRSRGNKKTELALVRLLRKERIRGWRRHASLLGRPDFTFRAERAVIFVDGCFWHGCLVHSKPPRTNCEYWTAKIRRNKKRDRTVARYLRKNGWRVLRLWEHDLTKHNLDKSVKRILKLLNRERRERERGRVKKNVLPSRGTW
jgi:DNA mismatch endonuclease (patch repair protein)